MAELRNIADQKREEESIKDEGLPAATCVETIVLSAKETEEMGCSPKATDDATALTEYLKGWRLHLLTAAFV